MHFLGMKWHNALKLPFLRVSATPCQGQEIELPLAINQPLTIQVQNERYCVGCSDHPEYRVNAVKYPGVLVDPRKALCQICLRKSRVYFMPLSTLNSEEKEILENRSNYNYVNLFGTELLKTGVVSAHKQFTRVLEQASTASVFFARTDGVKARELEHFISKELKIAQAVRWDTKLKLLGQPSGEAQARKILTQALETVKDELPTEFKAYLVEQAEFSYNLDYYHLQLDPLVTELYYISEVTGGDLISGVVAGVFGEILLLRLENSSQYYAFNTNSLLGYLFELETANSNQPILRLAKTPRKLGLKKLVGSG
jgi:hypothetical protein